MSWCDVDKVLRKEVDGRTVSGMEKAQERMRASEDQRMTAAILANFIKPVKTAQRLVETKISSIPADELRDMLQILQQHKASLPPPIQRDLLRRRTGELVKEQRWEELLSVVNPFSPEQAWDPFYPSLCAIENSMANKLKTYGKLVIETLMCDWVSQGEAAASQVLAFSTLALTTFAAVDCVDLDVEYSREFGEQLTIFRACVALCTKTLSTEHQEPLEAMHLRGPASRVWRVS